ncbi:ABC transporter ATP-binding protein [Salipiger mucosus]|uniref:Nitrous oxide reductase maturation protein NosF (ATPase) n=1 Tax=Salipiger mucosus DSM 16094 TaxID=1123237 RepID=S9RVD0_9RHOB|nr:ABC transporter ATP-binding protein [Salipiger mucosus]EPX77934.1 Nitrous oxide reductase maturation protein NosF (ATPase) [Salipiger mucosus DSM 16094]
MTDPILDIRNLCLSFGRLRALDNVSLSVQPGERLALLGHNGAGKSTLFKAVLGFLRPEAGRIAVTSHAPGTDAARIALNYLPEVVSFPRNLTGREVLDYFSGLRGAPRAAVSDLLTRVGLADAAERSVGTWSKGMRQRLGLAQALIGAPRLLLLDEPTSGLDPVSRQEFYAIIAEAAARGSAVFLSSHSLDEVQDRTDRVAILSQGRLRAEGTLTQLAAGAALPTRIYVTTKPGAADDLQAALGGRRANGCRLEIDCAPDAKLSVLARLGEHHQALSDIDVAAPGLNDIYRHFSRHDETEDRT